MKLFKLNALVNHKMENQKSSLSLSILMAINILAEFLGSWQANSVSLHKLVQYLEELKEVKLVFVLAIRLLHAGISILKELFCISLSILSSSLCFPMFSYINNNELTLIIAIKLNSENIKV